LYDVIIIGAGPGGYLAAERLGHAKKKVLLIEEQHLGGACLNMGCIPTKTLLNSAKQYVHALEAEKFGITVTGVSFNWGDIQKWKNEVIGKLRSGVAAQMKRFAVDVAAGKGEILSPPKGGLPGKVRVTLNAGGPKNMKAGRFWFPPVPSRFCPLFRGPGITPRRWTPRASFPLRKSPNGWPSSAAGSSA
jgi:dihydrolipoamide dehydrogenase